MPSLWSTLFFLAACRDDKASSPSTSASVTYYEDVKPILANHCTRCHHAAGLGVGDFTDLDTVLTFAPAMRAAVEDGRMPPPASDPACQDYVGSDILTLSPEEQAILSAWIDADMPLGDPANEPEIQAVSDQLSSPDLTLMMPSAYTPTYSDEANPGNEYRCFILEKNTDEPFYITALAPVIGQPSIAHHAVLFTIQEDQIPDALRSTDGMDCISDLGNTSTEGMIAAWAPGMLPIELPEGAGLLVGSNDQIVLQMHYFYSGPDTEGLSDLSGYAFRTAESVDTTVLMAALGIDDFDIPAHEEHHVDGGSFYNEYVDLQIYGMFPHMHVLGKAFDARITHADGTETCLVEGQYDFNNQMTYQFTNPIDFSMGDTISFNCTWNNSTSNEALITDEPLDTYYGERTDEEMCFFFSLVAVD